MKDSNDSDDAMKPTISRADQKARTRAALLNAAYTLFAEQGYAATSTENIVQRAGVTRGALYHHFSGKRGIFQAVYEEEKISRLQQIMERIQTAEGDLWQQLVETGCRAFLEVVSEPGPQRILYIDGPAVLPPRLWHDNTLAIATIQNALEQLAAAGFIAQQPFGTLACLFWGAFLEAALRVSYADDAEVTQENMRQGLIQLISGLRLPARS